MIGFFCPWFNVLHFFGGVHVWYSVITRAGSSGCSAWVEQEQSRRRQTPVATVSLEHDAARIAGRGRGADESISQVRSLHLPN